jgi:hypothetical protein
VGGGGGGGGGGGPEVCGCTCTETIDDPAATGAGDAGSSARPENCRVSIDLISFRLLSASESTTASVFGVGTGSTRGTCVGGNSSINSSGCDAGDASGIASGSVGGNVTTRGTCVGGNSSINSSGCDTGDASGIASGGVGGNVTTGDTTAGVAEVRKINEQILAKIKNIHDEPFFWNTGSDGTGACAADADAFSKDLKRFSNDAFTACKRRTSSDSFSTVRRNC